MINSFHIGVCRFNSINSVRQNTESIIRSKKQGGFYVRWRTDNDQQGRQALSQDYSVQEVTLTTRGRTAGRVIADSVKGQGISRSVSFLTTA